MKPTHAGALLRLAAPLILSMSTVTILQVIDAVVLGHHSEAAVAAMGPASFAVILVQGLLFGTAGYAGTLVATAFGANDPARVRRSTWMGLRFSAWTGIAALLLAWPLGEVFLHLGHAPETASGEALYFRTLVAGSVLPTLNAALSGWLAGIGRTRVSFLVSLGAFAANILVAPPLVLGWFGLPRMGLLGAAIATLVAQAVSLAAFALLFHRADGFRHPVDRVAEPGEMRSFLGLAVPQGLRISVELLAWTVFLAFVGRLGTEALAASSIAFRINGLAFFPALGLGQAAGILVAQARGGERGGDIRPIAFQALALGELWMLGFAGIFLFLPGPLLDVFDVAHPLTRADGILILRFVAFYCLFDAANVILASVLSSLGDTRWTLVVFLVATTMFIGVLGIADANHASVGVLWAMATIFVIATAIAWVWRFARRPVETGSGTQEAEDQGARPVGHAQEG